MNMNYIDDYTKGLSGEWFFSNYSVVAFFWFGQKVQDENTGEFLKLDDLRSLRKEGEFRLSDGKLIEVKTDCNCWKTGNVVVELTGRNGDVGWFQHCIQNKVSYICWMLYRKDKNGNQKKYPYRTMLIDFCMLEILVNEKLESPEYLEKNLKIKRDKDGSDFKILLIDSEEVYDFCGVKQTVTCPNACKVEFPDASTLYFEGLPTFDPPEEVRNAMHELIDQGYQIDSPVIDADPNGDEVTKAIRDAMLKLIAQGYHIGPPIIQFVPDDDVDAKELSKQIIQ